MFYSIGKHLSKLTGKHANWRYAMANTAKQKERRAELKDRLQDTTSPVPVLLKRMFDRMMTARRADARHVNYTRREWDEIGGRLQENLIKIARRHVVVIEVGGVPLRCQEATQKQIDYLNRIITE